MGATFKPAAQSAVQIGRMYNNTKKYVALVALATWVILMFYATMWPGDLLGFYRPVLP